MYIAGLRLVQFMFLRPKVQGVLLLGSRLILIQRDKKLETMNIHSDNQKTGLEELCRTILSYCIYWDYTVSDEQNIILGLENSESFWGRVPRIQICTAVSQGLTMAHLGTPNSWSGAGVKWENSSPGRNMVELSLKRLMEISLSKVECSKRRKWYTSQITEANRATCQCCCRLGHAGE